MPRGVYDRDAFKAKAVPQQQKKQRVPRLGDKVLYRNDTFKEHETPRLAHITGFGDGGLLHLTVSRNPWIDSTESSIWQRPNVILLSGDETPPRHVRDWCYYGEYSMADAGTITGRGRDIPMDDPEESVEDDELGAKELE